MKSLIIAIALGALSSIATASQQCDSLARYKTMQAQGHEVFGENQGFAMTKSDGSEEHVTSITRAIELFEPACAKTKRQAPRIGMSAKAVWEKSSWGEPDKVNRTRNARGTYEQWVYSDGYLYFTNGVLTSIQD